MPLSLSGIAVSRGIAIGRARLQQHGQMDIVEYVLPLAHIDDEVRRFEQAVAAARRQLETLRAKIPADTPQDIAAFIDTHLLMLDDSMLSSIPAELIRQHRCNAEWALKLQQDALVQAFDAMDDPYLRTRRDDVEHVVQRIQRILQHAEQQPGAVEIDGEEARVVVAVDLSPSDMVLLQQHNVAAIVTERGGPLSHMAIMARSLGIPAIVGVHHVHQYIRDGEPVVVDANNGALLCGLEQKDIAQFTRARRSERKARRELGKLRDEASCTLDGTEITLHANIELYEDIAAMRRAGAHGVGLYRTEFLYMNRATPPDEEEQLRVYRSTIRRLQGAPLTIRTLDLGADKGVSNDSISCSNSALGLRAVRLCLKEPELFRPQLRAILRASAYGPVRLLIPMLTNLGELRQVLELVDELKRELTREKKRFDTQIPLGGMIEVPAAAICADMFARKLDFFSIGTNDLMQYTLATDRIDETVSHLFDPLNPGVLRLIEGVIRMGHEAGIPVAMCGEMAGDPSLTRLLLALGLREFSAPPSTLLEVKHIIRNSDIGQLQREFGDLLASHDGDRLERKLAELNHNHKNFIFD
ncbi:MAG: phosphoenolpyruvate--protein phosphotransferase [Gammaproteobacteria bacterium]|nr:phosphoenolpyruvate--protein phosphotransferase [Gammaproteobacteria bacterium]MCW8841258.1 phosphoenolpyruvate--protein phosphotransferase [Gammaproteobacteria bacterium]MCW8958183.1 phosphoenolpyruvate--protein phosphotransferase [Gammaproteobacteria bacterium]MCW8973234.1 phosphoenolpyruvate--protein phosphotransferase [Gammaproteobacteria bacterium]MCW8991740.1 phosphoenolpyruvate--protein phosphotransferase [Gammaproteobacteria bacterium]